MNGLKKKLTILLTLLASTTPLVGQDWSLGIHSGAFVFGDFVERRLRFGTGEGPSEIQTTTLSAGIRPGLTVDLERALGERWAIRAEGAFTRAPLAIKRASGEDRVELEAGDLDVATFVLPVVFRINRGGTFRFHLMAGPAYAVYRITTTENVSGQIPLFTGSRTQWGGAVGGGVAWRWTENFAIEGNITDIVTTSPFRDDDFPDVPGITIEQPHNVHTTVGLRWSF